MSCPSATSRPVAARKLASLGAACLLAAVGILGLATGLRPARARARPGATLPAERVELPGWEARPAALLIAGSGRAGSGEGLARMTRAPVLAAPAPGAAGEPNPPTPPAAVSAGSSGAALPFHEAHWQGLELVPNTPLLARSLGLPAGAQGVIVDEATMPSDGAGFQAGDLVTAVGSVPTPDLAAFIRATERVRHRRRAAVQILRGATAFDLVLTAMRERLGTANGETAQTIAPASRAPHGYQGPCTDCHRIGTKGQLPADQGDLLDRTAPLIPAGRAAPHEDRGPCTACHAIRSQTRGEVPP